MKKIAINYSRSLPDHRVPVDYTFNRELMKGPSTYFRLVKEGFNATLTKHFHVAASLLSTAVLGFVTFYVYYSTDENDTHIGKKNFPTYKYNILTQRGGYGAYDNVLHQFEKEPGGIRDQPWQL